MKRWDENKNEWLKRNRGAGFDDILSRGQHIRNEDHPTRTSQIKMLFMFEDYVWVVVFDLHESKFKTAFPSRKHQKGFKK